AETGVRVVLRVKYNPVNVLPGSVVSVPDVLVNVMVSVFVVLLNEKSASAEMATPAWDVPLPLEPKVQSPRLFEGIRHAATAVRISSLIARTRLKAGFQKLLNISAPFALLSFFL